MFLRGSKSSGRFVRWLLASLALLFVLIFPGAARAVGPCCNITGIDSRSGVVTARVNATGQTIQFAVKNSALLSSLKVGQGIYANLGAKQVSIDGRAVCCAIVSMGAAPGPLAPGSRPGIPRAASPPPPASAPVDKPAPAAAAVAAGRIENSPTPSLPCCNITAIKTSTDVVTAKENGTGKIFQFKANDATLLNSLKIGQGVYANFAAKQVSLNGSTPVGSIITGDTAYTGFDPNIQGFKFINFFTGQILIDIPLFGTRDLGPTSYGLCGGMSYAALDNFISGGTIPNDPTAPVSGTPLRSYLYARQHDTFVADDGWMIRRFIEWVAHPDTTKNGITGLDVLSDRELEGTIRPQLAAGHPVPLGVVKANVSVGSFTSTDENVLIKNHQVLAIGYDLHQDPARGTHWDIRIYDPNFPDTIQRMHTHSNVAGYQTDDANTHQTDSFRGFFATPYSPKQPYWVSGGKLVHGVAIIERVPAQANRTHRQ